MIELFGYDLSIGHVAVLALVAMLVGMAKTGVAGAGMIAVPLLALIFGGKASTGMLLPFLIIADVFAVKHYHRHANWSHLRRLLPFAVLGVAIGTALGKIIDNQMFTWAMAAIIFASLGIMLWQEKQKDANVPTSPWFASSIGVLGGITTMIGNLAGPVMTLYLLAMRFPKNEFIGTAAWFFMTINLIKIPFHVFVWETITVNSVLLNLSFIPAVALGAWLGIKIIATLSEKLFRNFILAMTVVAALALVI